MMTIKILPCPYCGNKEPELEILPTTNCSQRIVCRECITIGPLIIDEDFEAVRIQAIEAWNALPRPLRWTKEKPTKDNHWQWFWYNEGIGSDPYPVFIQNACTAWGTEVCSSSRPDSHCFLPVDKMGGYWAGPIQEPMEK